MARPLAPKGGNDQVYTPPALAKAIVDHFQPAGVLCDPCYGKKAFSNKLKKRAKQLWLCDIDDGDDFLELLIPIKMDWTITNPPWSKLRPFLQRSMEISDNVVFLCLVNAFFMKARQRDMKEAGFGMKEILFVPTPDKPWPQTGFSLGAVHIQLGWTGDCKMTQLEN